MNEGYMQTKIRELENKLVDTNIELKKALIKINTLVKKIERQDEVIYSIEGLDLKKINDELIKNIQNIILKQKNDMIEQIKKSAYKYVDETISPYDKSINMCLKSTTKILDSLDDTQLFDEVVFTRESLKCFGTALRDKKILSTKELRKLEIIAKNKAEKRVKKFTL